MRVAVERTVRLRPYSAGMTASPEPVVPDPVVEVRRSTRRSRTVSAYRDGDRIIVLMPARLARAEQERLVSEMVQRVTSREQRLQRSGPRASDRALLTRAGQLSREYLAGRANPVTVRWATNMQHRWGSCTVGDGTIRLSHRLRTMPAWVIDYVLVHELAHLLVPGHGPDFWALVGRYPRTERARGYLEGVAMAAQMPGLSDGFSGDESASGVEVPDEFDSFEVDESDEGEADSGSSGVLF